MAYGTVNADVIGTSVTGSNLGAGNASIMKNRLINGDMRIDQRNAGASVTPTNGAYTLDRWYSTANVASKFTVQQNAGSVTPPVGFSKYLGVTSSSAYSIAAGDIFTVAQYIEGFNSADLGFGTANAKTVTLSFQVYSSLTGTFGGALKNNAYDRAYPFTYSIPVANTWTSISITIAGDTTGTWVGATNGIGINLVFGIGVGSTASATAGSWQAGNYYSATGATSVVGTSGATFYITGVQLEVGSSATGFEYVNYQTSLANCQRYFRKTDITTYSEGTIFGYNTTGNVIGQSSPYPVTMRASATTAYGGSWTLSNATQSVTASQSNYFAYINVASTGYAYQYPNANGYITFSAEL